MFTRSVCLVAATALLASISQASAGLVGLPINLKFTLEASNTPIKASADKRTGACLAHTDDVFAGPVAIWTC